MPRRPLPESTIERIRSLSGTGVPAKEIACLVGVSEATVSKYRGRKGLTDKDRFEEKFTPEPNSGCWLWEGAVTTVGRPYAVESGEVMPASRAAWRIYRGDIPGGLFVLHNCHNKACVNPSHLRLGTPQDNVDDMFAAGREPKNGDRQRAVAVLGEHHHISGGYLRAYAGEMAWREDNRRQPNGALFTLVAAAAMDHPVSRTWKGYWQR